ncbi:MAG: hypothetical protein RXP86_07740 [Acidilobus sp.]
MTSRSSIQSVSKGSISMRAYNSLAIWTARTLADDTKLLMANSA